MTTLAGLCVFALALIVTALTGSLVGAVAVALVRRHVLDCEPATRHRVLFVLAVMPAFVGITLLLCASLPAFVALANPAADHCIVHDDGHAHLCFRHLPSSVSPVVLVGLAGLALAMLAKTLRSLRRFHRHQRLLGTLVATAEHDASLDVSIVESPLPICMATGALRPRILVARALLDALEDEERTIVLAHERCHVERRDALIAAIASLAASLHMRWIGRWLRAELGIAAEQVCDEQAARIVGDRVAVAATILVVQRAWSAEPGHVDSLGVAFAGACIERRVRSLLAPPLRVRSFAVLAWCLALAAALEVTAAGELHHLVESFVSHLAF
jgi:Zn-dependent protease with chaperone function